MTTPARVAAAAVIGVLAIGGAFYMLSPEADRASVRPARSPRRRRRRRPAPRHRSEASRAIASDALPPEIWDSWQARAPMQSHPGCIDATMTIHPS